MSVLQSNINRIVVLMLENRSFDNLLGFLYPASANFDGLTGNETNPGPNGPVKVGTTTGKTNPDPDPLEKFVDFNQQLFGEGPIGDYNRTDPPPMNGFVLNYQQAIRDYNLKHCFFRKTNRNPSRIMNSTDASLLKNLTHLARQYAVCDRWFCPVPAQTWPNRRFAMAATSKGDVNNTPVLQVFTTIFDRIAESGKASWGVFGGDVQSAAVLFPHLPLLYPDRFHLGLDEFRSLCQNNGGRDLPNFCWVEPFYFDNENDMHPPSDVTPGDHYIGQVYNCLRSSGIWNQTLFIITFDEHGGTYDHVSPPATAQQPDGFTNQEFGFRFQRFGARVPTVLISPWIRQGTVYRATQPGKTLDHTSIIATLRQRFDLGGQLTNRDGAAPTLDDLLNLPSPRAESDCPGDLDEGPGIETVNYSGRQLNDLQRSFLATAAAIPPAAQLHEWLARARGAVPDGKAAAGGEAPPDKMNVGAARKYIHQRMQQAREMKPGAVK